MDRHKNERDAIGLRPVARLGLAILAACVAGGCVTFAAPPPFVTAGGPRTAPARGAEVALGVGTGSTLFKDATAGGRAWMGRWRHGVGRRFDVGFDMLGATHGDRSTFTVKAAGRYRVRDRVRLEAGFGAANDSNGKSLGIDVGATFGRDSRRRDWNPYWSIRLAQAWGFPGDVFSPDEDEPEEAPPDASFVLLSSGVTGRVSDRQRVFFEGGIGSIKPAGHEAGPVIYVGVGLLFDIGGRGASR